MHRLQNCYGQIMSFMKIDLSPTFGARFVQRLLVIFIFIFFPLKFHFLCKHIGKKKKILPCVMFFKKYFIRLKIVNMLGMNCYMFFKSGELC
jgi:hypothetical protein